MQLQNLIQGKDLKCTTAFSLSLRPLLFSPLGVLENTIANNHKLLFLSGWGEHHAGAISGRGSAYLKKKKHISRVKFLNKKTDVAAQSFIFCMSQYTVLFFFCAAQEK